MQLQSELPGLSPYPPPSVLPRTNGEAKESHPAGTTTRLDLWRSRALTAEAELEKLKAASFKRREKYKRYKLEVKRLNKAHRFLGLEFDVLKERAEKQRLEYSALAGGYHRLLEETGSRLCLL
jgi:hypothetical protein